MKPSFSPSREVLPIILGRRGPRNLENKRPVQPMLILGYGRKETKRQKEQRGKS